MLLFLLVRNSAESIMWFWCSKMAIWYSLRSLSQSSILVPINKNDGVLICIHLDIWIPKTLADTLLVGYKHVQYVLYTFSIRWVSSMCVRQTSNTLFLHGNSLREAVWSRKIHVQIMRFTCCLNMAFTWKSLNWALICMHDVALEGVAAVTDHFAHAFVRDNVARV